MSPWASAAAVRTVRCSTSRAVSARPRRTSSARDVPLELVATALGSSENAARTPTSTTTSTGPARLRSRSQTTGRPSLPLRLTVWSTGRRSGHRRRGAAPSPAARRPRARRARRRGPHRRSRAARRRRPGPDPRTRSRGGPRRPPALARLDRPGPGPEPPHQGERRRATRTRSSSPSIGGPLAGLRLVAACLLRSGRHVRRRCTRRLLGPASDTALRRRLPRRRL